MAILNAVTIQPRSPEVWDDLQKLLKRIKEMVVKKGGENVTVLVTMIGGESTSEPPPETGEWSDGLPAPLFIHRRPQHSDIPSSPC